MFGSDLAPLPIASQFSPQQPLLLHQRKITHSPGAPHVEAWAAKVLRTVPGVMTAVIAPLGRAGTCAPSPTGPPA